MRHSAASPCRTSRPCKNSKEAKETRGDQGYGFGVVALQILDWDSTDTLLDAICQHGLHQSSVRQAARWTLIKHSSVRVRVRVHDGHRLQC